MSKVYFISDLHLGHKQICEFSGAYRGNCKTMDEHHEWLIDSWNSVVKKQDMVMVHGDVCFNKDYLHLMKKFRGSKHLIIGNHDQFPLAAYLQYFNKVHGFMKYKGCAWLSHCPIHPNELRGKFNIHGHVHQNTIDDLRYINISVEALNGRPISWEMIQTIMADRKILMRMNLKESSTTSVSTADIVETSGTDDSKA